MKRLYPDIDKWEFSLKTPDVNVARKIRDKFNGELAHNSLVATNPEAQKFRQLVREMSEAKKISIDWDAWIDTKELEDRNDQVTLDAYRTVNGKQDHSAFYAFSLRDALAEWFKGQGFNKTKETQNKTKQSVELFLEYHDLGDISISQITRRMAYDFLRDIELRNAKTTCQAHLSRLKMVWKHAKDLGEVEGDNPFAEHTYTGQSEDNKYQMFNSSELQKILALIAEQPAQYELLVKLGIFTGCRISELCDIKKRNLIKLGDISYVYIEKGKTSSATRNVPLHDEIAQQLWRLAEQLSDDDPILGLTGKSASRWFSNFKTNKITTDRTKAFHSFRVMFITALKRSDVSEYLSAEIVGHERGRTMSYGYYAKDSEIHRLYECTQSAVDYIKRNWI
jgi:integrase